MAKTPDSFGAQANLKSGPRNVEHQGGVGGGTFESFGVGANLNRSPASNAFSNNGRGLDSFAAEVALKREPQHGWNSANTPMSERAIKQSK